jgi:hypothetical protein
MCNHNSQSRQSRSRGGSTRWLVGEDAGSAPRLPACHTGRLACCLAHRRSRTLTGPVIFFCSPPPPPPPPAACRLSRCPQPSTRHDETGQDGMHHSARAHGSTGIRWPCRGRGCVSLQATRLARWDGSQFQTGPRGRLLLFGSCLLSAPVGSAGLVWSGRVGPGSFASASASYSLVLVLVLLLFLVAFTRRRPTVDSRFSFSLFPSARLRPPSSVPRPTPSATLPQTPARRGAPARPFLSLLPAAAYALTLSASPRLSPPITDPPRVSRLSPLASRLSPSPPHNARSLCCCCPHSPQGMGLLLSLQPFDRVVCRALVRSSLS